MSEIESKVKEVIVDKLGVDEAACLFSSSTSLEDLKPKNPICFSFYDCYYFCYLL